MKKTTSTIEFVLCSLVSTLISALIMGYLSVRWSKTAYNNGYTDGYQDVAKEFSEARDKYFEASIELKTALIDLMEYKIKLQEKEGCK